MPAGFGIIRSSNRCTITCCGPPRRWWRSARWPSALRNAASIRHGSPRAAAYALPEDTVHAGRARSSTSRRCETRSNRTATLRDLAVGRLRGGHAALRHLRQARRQQGLVRAARRDASAQGRRIGVRPGRAGAWQTGCRSAISGPRQRELGLTDRVLQIPFLPHWRVPEFLRGCLAVCCLEQDFPIGFHSPIIPLEVLLCGSCLVASTEVIRKLPQWDRLPHGYGCVAINNVNDLNELSGKLAAIVRKPKLVAAVGARGHAFAQDSQGDSEFPGRLEQILQAAAQRKLPPITSRSATTEPAEIDGFTLTRMAVVALRNSKLEPAFDIDNVSNVTDLSSARKVLARLRKAISAGKENSSALCSGCRG